MEISFDQLFVFVVLAAMLVLFIWNKIRYDIVALLGLIAVALAGLVPPAKVFEGFGHPAVITVATVLVISRGLVNSGVVDSIARRLTRVGKSPFIQVITLTAVITISSGFMNNVGALALLMPVAIWMSRQSARSPSFLLMPIAFGSLLGGTMTLVGTPPNIIIASYRQQTGSAAFSMFDFLPVGGLVALGGLIFIALIGWRLTPKRRSQKSGDDIFEISAYLTEVLVPDTSKFAGQTLYQLTAAVHEEAEIIILALIRSENTRQSPPMFEILQAGDILLVEGDSNSIKTLLDIGGLKLAEKVASEKSPSEKQVALNLVEVIVTPGSNMVNRSATELHLRVNYGVNILAVARQGQRLSERIGKVTFMTGDILLIQGPDETLSSALGELGCLPLASRGLHIGKTRNVILAAGIFIAALTLMSANILSVTIALTGAAVLMIFTNLLTPNEAYKSIDMPIIVLLAAMLPIGGALETTGGSLIIANSLDQLARSFPIEIMLGILMLSTMLLSNVINNAATAILAAPIAINLAASMQVSSDALLMAVAIGSSCTFLTPIGHQSNTLVMVPGGYKFGDYWRMGLPLSIIVILIAIPAIVYFWLL